MNTRREPGTRRQSRGTGGGLPLEKGTARAVLGSTCRRKAFWIDQVAVLDVAVAEAVLGSSNEPGRKAGRARGATESVRGPSPASYAVENAAARWRSREGSPSGSSESLGWRRTRGRNGPKLRSCRQAHLTRGRVAARRAGVASSSDSRVRARRGRRRRKSSSLENRTIAGARVVGRLQKSVRSTFLVPVEGSREANRASTR